ncbi:MAG: DUF1624 domain-containing protein [Gemmatimonadetes bacterium]|nr:DUF1624 domain-containing protein [Gemmatimonadota bacterium]
MELPVTAAPADDPRARRTGLDALRGLVMVIMALDHVRDFIHHDAMLRQPEDLATTTPLLFFTRWITHFVAPTFSLAAGIGAYLWWRRGRTRGELARFLATRGLWLVVLEVTVMRLAYNFTPSLQYPLLLLVLWVLGLSMLVLAALVWLPPRALAVLSLAVIALHNLLDGIRAADLGAAAPLWNLLHQPGAFPVGGLLVIVGYPLIPWAFVMALGFAAGMVYEWPAAERERHLVRAGLAMVAAFVLLRALNGYGDPAPWSRQDSPVFTLLSFLKTTKYPPSLLFLLMTLGPACLLLAGFERARLGPAHPLVIFGRVPLFYFVVHFALAHLAAVLLGLARYGNAAWGWAFLPLPTMGGPADRFPPDFGWPLGVAYLVWAGVVVALYPLCRWFAGVKARRRDWWLSYL